MLSPARSLSINIEAEPDKRGCRLHYCNASLVSLTVSVPHPREHVWLFQNDKSLNRDAFPIVWRKEPPQRLEPGEELIVEIRLCHFWMDVKGMCRVECVVTCCTEGSLDEQIKVSGEIEVDLPSLSQQKAENQAAIQKYGLGNIPARPTIVILK